MHQNALGIEDRRRRSRFLIHSECRLFVFTEYILLQLIYLWISFDRFQYIYGINQCSSIHFTLERDIMELAMHPIGVIRSPFTEKADTPIQSSRSKAIGTVELFSDFVDGLKDVEGFSHIILLYYFHCSSGYELHVKPFLDNHLRGLFATRHPCRPNPIGMSIVRLLNIHNNRLEVEGVDVLDNTPLLDIKPYVSDFDVRSEVRTGWYEKRKMDD